MVGLLITILIVGLIYYLITLLPLPAPFKTVALVVFILILIIMLLGWIPGGPYPIHRW